MFAEETASSGDSPAPVPAKPATRRVKTAGKPKSSGRSRATNNPFAIKNVDPRSTWLRRARDVVGILVADRGGADMVSGGTELVIRRIATLTVTIERIEEKWARQWAREEEIDAAEIDLYQRTSNTLRRHLETVGLDRVPRDVTPSPEAYHANLAAERARRAAEDAETADEPSEVGQTRHGPPLSHGDAISAEATA